MWLLVAYDDNHHKVIWSERFQTQAAATKVMQWLNDHNWRVFLIADPI